MYFKSARGHARSYMQSMRTRQTFEEQMHGDYYARIHMAFHKSAKSKKPGRVLQRIKKTLDKDWMDLELLRWTKNDKAVSARIITYDADAPIEIQSDYDRTSFTDDLIQLNELIFEADYFKMGTLRGSLVSMTLHALTRVIERDGCEPEDLPVVIPELMRIARHVVVQGFTESYPEATNSFLIPYQGGAFVAINCPAKSSEGASTAKTDGLSIRTWLSPEMITPEMDQRLHAMDAFLEATYHDDKGWTQKQVQAELDRNARPHDYRKKSPSKAPIPAFAPRASRERAAATAVAAFA